MAEKKSRAEKAKTRNAQYKRRNERRRQEGLQRVGDIWVPREAMERAGKGLVRVGVVLAAPGTDTSPAVYVREADGRLVRQRHDLNLLKHLHDLREGTA